ncbi:MAG: hypothetical protein CMH63_00570 [Nanoarchaeota archaeon]|nr:hypothetical protein [Nanoarchaeota archaeon]|tara:strand:+ start:4071 stop:4667 length:597 start_codon:yes stop_codon:yes gene_type:complete
MKLFLFTDPHGDKKTIFNLIKKIKKSKPDLILCAGDLTNFGDNLRGLILKFESLKIPMLIIPGNHETNSDLNKALKKTKNILNLHKKSYELNNYLFFGYGLRGFEEINKDLEIIIPQFKKTVKDHQVILMTHQPPYNTKLDYLKDIGHQGNKSIRKFIRIIKPILAISGHLHENENKKDKIYSTKILNPGTNGMVIEV